MDVELVLVQEARGAGGEGERRTVEAEHPVAGTGRAIHLGDAAEVPQADVVGVSRRVVIEGVRERPALLGIVARHGGGIEAVPAGPHGALRAVGRDLDQLVAAHPVAARVLTIFEGDRAQRAVRQLDEVVREKRDGDGGRLRAVQRDAHDLGGRGRLARDLRRVVEQALAVDGQPRAIEVQLAIVGVVPDDLALRVDDGDRGGRAQHRHHDESVEAASRHGEGRHAHGQRAGVDGRDVAGGDGAAALGADHPVEVGRVRGQAQQGRAVHLRRCRLDRRARAELPGGAVLDVAGGRHIGLPVNDDHCRDLIAHLGGDHRRAARVARAAAAGSDERQRAGHSRAHQAPPGERIVRTTGAGV